MKAKAAARKVVMVPLILSRTILAAIEGSSGISSKAGIFFWLAYLDTRMGNQLTYTLRVLL